MPQPALPAKGSDCQAHVFEQPLQLAHPVLDARAARHVHAFHVLSHELQQLEDVDRALGSGQHIVDHSSRRLHDLKDAASRATHRRNERQPGALAELEHGVDERQSRLHPVERPACRRESQSRFHRDTALVSSVAFLFSLGRTRL